jgi:RNA polymerase-binding transcription factor DksA
LREVEQGLVHLHTPDYGICAACSAEISYSRLSVNPAATRCARCQVRFEHGWPHTAEHTF